MPERKLVDVPPSYHLTVEGIPVPQPRPRGGRMRGGGASFYSNNRRVSAWKDRIACQYEQVGGKQFETPVCLKCDFYFERPIHGKEFKRLPAGMVLRPYRPDLDNLVKAIMDGLNGVAWVDDKQIVYIEACKWYSEKGGFARVELSVAEVKQE